MKELNLSQKNWKEILTQNDNKILELTEIKKTIHKINQTKWVTHFIEYQN
jgi:hypothetical protein